MLSLAASRICSQLEEQAGVVGSQLQSFSVNLLGLGRAPLLFEKRSLQFKRWHKVWMFDDELLCQRQRLLLVSLLGKRHCAIQSRDERCPGRPCRLLCKKAGRFRKQRCRQHDLKRGSETQLHHRPFSRETR